MFSRRAGASGRRMIAVAAVGLMLTGCAGGGAELGSPATQSEGSTSESPSGSSSPDAGAGDARTAPESELQRFYDQEISWAPCEGGECGQLEVPVDYAEPDGDTIELALLRNSATGESIGSLVVNPGGPGSPGTTYAQNADQAFRPPLTERYDVVGFDPRGTGKSSPVDCLSDDELDEYLSADPSPDTKKEQRELIGWSDRLGEGCLKNSGPIVGHVTTIEAARDMDVLRAALDDDQLDYLGASYGTKLGATYAELFPERVGRFVLDGALDVSASTHDINLEQGKGFETALEAYVESCVDGDDCYLGKDLDAGRKTIRDFLDGLDRKPLPTGDDDRPLTEARGLSGIILPLYVSDYWFLLDDALKIALEEGDGSKLLVLADTYNSRNPDGTYLDNSAEAIWAINCLDDPWYASPKKVLASVPAFEKASPTLGRSFAWFDAACTGIQVKSSEEPLTIDAEGAAPILVTGTTRDPATPFHWAKALADQLDSGVLIERNGDGHTAYNSGNACVDEAIEAYLIDGTVPEGGLKC